MAKSSVTPHSSVLPLNRTVPRGNRSIMWLLLWPKLLWYFVYWQLIQGCARAACTSSQGPAEPIPVWLRLVTRRELEIGHSAGVCTMWTGKRCRSVFLSVRLVVKYAPTHHGSKLVDSLMYKIETPTVSPLILLLCTLNRFWSTPLPNFLSVPGVPEQPLPKGTLPRGGGGGGATAFNVPAV